MAPGHWKGAGEEENHQNSFAGFARAVRYAARKLEKRGKTVALGLFDFRLFSNRELDVA